MFESVVFCVSFAYFIRSMNRCFFTKKAFFNLCILDVKLTYSLVNLNIVFIYQTIKKIKNEIS